MRLGWICIREKVDHIDDERRPAPEVGTDAKRAEQLRMRSQCIGIVALARTQARDIRVRRGIERFAGIGQKILVEARIDEVVVCDAQRLMGGIEGEDAAAVSVRIPGFIRE